MDCFHDCPITVQIGTGEDANIAETNAGIFLEGAEEILHSLAEMGSEGN
jgi:hypothetical protein